LPAAETGPKYKSVLALVPLFSLAEAPEISKRCRGLVVPIPTAPVLRIVRAGVPSVKFAAVVVGSVVGIIWKSEPEGFETVADAFALSRQPLEMFVFLA
jgi:hypothetical protein